MRMPPIQIVDKPRIVSPSDVIGSALDIPLNETPDQRWLRHFVPPTDRIEVQDRMFRAWLTQAIQANSSAFLDRLNAAIEKANADREREIEEQRRVFEAHERAAKERRAQLAEDVDQWWEKRDPPEGD